ncbi:MAG TPA: GDSL-type esterase/lipase family protein [Thermoleophilaceae bacterium]|jgi:hypothetical protein|nr:GDSL-type esterase/lipase family protein [Thermoleophilaceae bacterium]
MEPRRRNPLTMPAGRVLGVILIALGIAALFNSAAMVRAGESMKRGNTRDMVLSVAHPLDDFAGAVGLHLPRDGLDKAFGQESKTGESRLQSGSTAILRANRRKQRQQTIFQPTPQHEVNLFVTGDSEAQFVGEVLTDMLPSNLFDVSVIARNATGLTNPEFFNWDINARQEIAARKPDAVVMVIGGNDGFNVAVNGQVYGPDTPQWQLEYARRTAVVMQELGSNGKRPVYWVPPPTARDTEFNKIYETENKAVEQAARAVPGARYVDIYSTLNHGRYSDVLKIDGRKVLARQPDGIHFSRAGAVAPARLILRAMAKDYKVLGDAAN